MILRRLTKHVKDQNWFAVALDFVIVVVGVCVALMGQQWLSDRQQREDMRRAEIPLKEDVLWIYFYAKERLALVNCRTERYQAIAQKLLEPETTWEGIPPIATDPSRNNALPMALRSPSRSWGSKIWDAELARGTFNQMDDERLLRLDNLFTAAREAENLQNDILDLQGELKVLAVSTTIIPGERLGYYNVLGRLDEKSVHLEIIAAQIIATIELIGVDMTPEDRTSALSNLKERNEIGRAIYGDCHEPMTWPVLENKAANESVP